MVIHRRVILLGTAALWLAATGCEDRGGGDRRAEGQTAQAGQQGQPGGPSQPGTTGGQAGAGSTVTGQVVSTTSDEVVLKESGKDEELKLKVDPSTEILIDGEQGSVEQIREGAQVRASFDPSSQKATRIEASGGAGGAGSSVAPGGEEGSQQRGETGSAPRGGGGY